MSRPPEMSPYALGEDVVKRLKNIATKKGWQVTEEPNIRDLSGRLLKPDLLMTKGSSIVISDVSVSWEAPEPLGTAYRTKKTIYSDPVAKVSAPDTQEWKLRYAHSSSVREEDGARRTEK